MRFKVVQVNNVSDLIEIVQQLTKLKEREKKWDRHLP